MQLLSVCLCVCACCVISTLVRQLRLLDADASRRRPQGHTRRAAGPALALLPPSRQQLWRGLRCRSALASADATAPAWRREPARQRFGRRGQPAVVHGPTRTRQPWRGGGAPLCPGASLQCSPPIHLTNHVGSPRHVGDLATAVLSHPPPEGSSSAVQGWGKDGLCTRRQFPQPTPAAAVYETLWTAAQPCQGSGPHGGTREHTPAINGWSCALVQRRARSSGGMRLRRLWQL